MDIHIQMLCVLCCEKVSFIHHRRNTEVRTLPLALLQFVRGLPHGASGSPHMIVAYGPQDPHCSLVVLISAVGTFDFPNLARIARSLCPPAPQTPKNLGDFTVYSAISKQF